MIQRHDSLIVEKITRLLIPFIQVFALYVYFHGHYSPGGGFQAGVLLGASFILELLVGTRRELSHLSVRSEFLLATLGVGIFAGVGGLALINGGRYFDYGVISLFGSDPAMRRYWGILLAEGGVAMVVSMTLLVIFHVLAFLPERTGKKQP